MSAKELMKRLMELQKELILNRKVSDTVSVIRTLDLTIEALNGLKQGSR